MTVMYVHSYNGNCPSLDKYNLLPNHGPYTKCIVLRSNKIIKNKLFIADFWPPTQINLMPVQ